MVDEQEAAVKAKRAKPARVGWARINGFEGAPVRSYLAASQGDDHEVHVNLLLDYQKRTLDERHAIEHAEFMRANTTEALAREFGPWVKAADGSWFRDRKRRRKR
jgi:hypothetical protein